METANTDDAMRRAAAEAFESWIAVLAAQLNADGYDPERAQELALHVFCSLEGAFVHSRATRTVTALEVAQKSVIATLDANPAPPRC